ncbi:hypothetical protein [Endozoicomonas ascidiicola]|uniref:hypothetical protein n=1 Tax=Endozoicomonas ascidiicola TaxID=1698521 RepID=UPI00082B039D|nr:hypothetical protein [Endozoicomonas ascidiicola]
MTKHNQEMSAVADELLRQFAQTAEDDLSAILTTQDLADFQKKITKRERKYPACKTLSLFMKQVASDTKSCRNVLIDDARDQVALGKEKNETTTGPYCQARQRLLEEAVKSLLHTSGNNLDKGTHKAYLWHKKRVVLADGSKLSMPDTEANQAEYPQPKSKKKGAGFSSIKNYGSDCTGQRCCTELIGNSL